MTTVAPAPTAATPSILSYPQLALGHVDDNTDTMCVSRSAINTVLLGAATVPSVDIKSRRSES